MNVRLAYILSAIFFLVSAKMAWDWIRQREPAVITYDPAQSTARLPEYMTLKGVWLAHTDYATGSRLGQERNYVVVRSKQAPQNAGSNLVLIVSDPTHIAALKTLDRKTDDGLDAEALGAMATLANKNQVTGLISTSAVNAATRVKLREVLPALQPGYAVLVEGEKPSLGPVLLGFGISGAVFLAAYTLRPKDSVDAPPVIAESASDGPKPAAPPISPLLAKAPTTSFRQEILRELEAVDGGAKDDYVTVTIGMLKLGAPELLAGWLKAFAQADVYVVSVEANNPQTAFVFGPEGDRNYVAVFTRLNLAMQCLKEMPQLKFTMKIKGRDLLQLAQGARRGIWLNPLNEACTVKFPAVMMARFIKETNRG